MSLPSNDQSQAHKSRVRSASNLAAYSSTHSGGIRKKTVTATTAAAASRTRSISTPHLDRLHQLALEQSAKSAFQPAVASSSNEQTWFTPQHSPETSTYFQDSTHLDLFPQWTVPTPPRSESSVPSLSIDIADETSSTGVTSSASLTFDPATTSEMSSLGFLLPSQYGSGMYTSDMNNYSMDQNYDQPIRQQPATTSQSPYSQTISSSPALYQSRPVPHSTGVRRMTDLPPTSNASGPTYPPSGRRMTNPYEPPATNTYQLGPTQTIPSISGLTASPMSSPNLSNVGAGVTTQYAPAIQRSPGMYDQSFYTQPLTTAQQAPSQIYAPSSSLSYPPTFTGGSASNDSPRTPGDIGSMRVLNQRPKPQCWEHGCNGREFSTFSNLLRHQREKSGTATKSYCPKCGAEFTRTTARNGHLAHDKCTKTRRHSEDNIS